ncbi:MAG: hypothetical protein AAF922_13350 [Pseudomonadota bacterium]
MNVREEFEARSVRLTAAFREKLGVRSASLPQALKRSKRLLPRPVRASGAVLVDAQQKLNHPKIARQLDSTVIERAFQTVEAHLKAIDTKERRKDARLRWLALMILNMALIAALLIAILRWQGLA